MSKRRRVLNSTVIKVLHTAESALSFTFIVFEMTSARLKPGSPIWGRQAHTHWNTKHFCCAFTKSNRAGCVRGSGEQNILLATRGWGGWGWGGGSGMFSLQSSQLSWDLDRIGTDTTATISRSRRVPKALPWLLFIKTRAIFILEQEVWTQALPWTRTTGSPGARAELRKEPFPV